MELLIYSVTSAIIIPGLEDSFARTHQNWGSCDVGVWKELRGLNG